MAEGWTMSPYDLETDTRVEVLEKEWHVKVSETVNSQTKRKVKTRLISIGVQSAVTHRKVRFTVPYE